MFLDRFIRLLMPRQDSFFILLEEMGRQIQSAATIFSELIGASGHEQFEDIATRLKQVEVEADKLCHRVYEEMDRRFVTPIDREDLAHLTNALDDVIDGMEHSAAFTVLFRFDALTPPMREMVRITTQAGGELARAVVNFGKLSDPNSLRAPTVAVHTLENEGDAVYRAAVEALFENGTDARELVRQKDMLFSMEAGVDACENAMDIIRSVVVKNI